MLCGGRRATLIVLLGSILFVPPANAAKFDLIHFDHVDVSLCQSCGLTAGPGFALLVNTGNAPITDADLGSVTFAVTSSRPEIALTPYLNLAFAFGLTMPHEALGLADSRNSLLLGFLQPGEVLRNTAPQELFGLAIDRNGGPNTYEGEVDFDVLMTMGSDVAHFVIRVDVHLLQPPALGAFSFLSAARTSSVVIPTRAKPSTWGSLKSLYR